MHGDPHRLHYSRIAPLLVRAGIVMVLASFCLGCSNGKNKPEVVDADAYPSNYKDQVATFLMTMLTNSADFRNAMISPPVLKPVGHYQHYVACVLFNGRNEHTEKAVVYFAGNINQYVDATPEECGGVDYQPFPELAKAAPR